MAADDNSRPLTEGEIRSLAVEVVDAVHGYTCEFSSQPTVHEMKYDQIEELLAARLRCTEVES